MQALKLLFRFDIWSFRFAFQSCLLCCHYRHHFMSQGRVQSYPDLYFVSHLSIVARAVRVIHNPITGNP